ncbi:hypothetical protein [Spongiivirga citrea]|uniref:Uncharacterized protein n=1 Tax=Spongiivirga citrea TaxID=1481457 RepID=A0A6M0CJV9_9FLAO|nr:hypothetical protein [Spongiivirga citrea]NER18228.1 hypothetical protein [Spongiivirga citrea]
MKALLCYLILLFGCLCSFAQTSIVKQNDIILEVNDEMSKTGDRCFVKENDLVMASKVHLEIEGLDRSTYQNVIILASIKQIQSSLSKLHKSRFFNEKSQELSHVFFKTSIQLGEETKHYHFKFPIEELAKIDNYKNPNALFDHIIAHNNMVSKEKVKKQSV